MNILTILGARPQFVKAAALSRAIRERAGQVSERIVHTGQHYDPSLSQVFFDELDIPAPSVHLDIAGGNHGAMTGRMLEGIERIIEQDRPDWVLVYGDTNSTLAGALAAAKLHVPIAHVEAGLRSFNRRMPEEVNRVLTDHISTLLLCPTETAVQNLHKEGITAGVHNVGDVMYDIALYWRERARTGSRILDTLGLAGKNFALATCHRAENTDDPARLGAIVSALLEINRELPVVLPLHLRTRKCLQEHGLLHTLNALRLIDPVPFLDMIALEQAAQVILTDSGGVQKEAFFYQVPCITLRDETEWVETVDLGWNRLTGAEHARIIEAFASTREQHPDTAHAPPYGNGAASQLILDALLAA